MILRQIGAIARTEKKRLFALFFLITALFIAQSTPLLSARQSLTSLEQNREIQKFGISYTTIQEVILQLIQKDPSLLSAASEVERALLRLEEQTHSYTQFYPLKETIYEGESGATVIESIPSLKATVIYLPEPAFFIGYGHHKRVSKALFIQNSMVYVVAHCITDQSAIQEMAIFSALQSAPGIVPYLGSIARNNGSEFSLFLLYCDRGALSSYLKSPEKKLSLKNSIRVARDIAIGLQSLHQKKYIHFDLHAGNCFLMEVSSGHFTGFVGDFGHTFHIKEKGKKTWYITKRRSPPESACLPLNRIDRYKTDTYALGTIFYKMIWREFHPWRDLLPSVKMHTWAARAKREVYKKIVASYKSSRKGHIGCREYVIMGVEDQAQERFKALCYDLLHYNPNKRPSLKSTIHELDTILELLENQT
ncbi:MAG: protein kinase [Chlamydia sp.]